MVQNRELIPRRAVEDGFGNMIRTGDTVRHQLYGRDAVVTVTYTAVHNGVRYNEIAIGDEGGPWIPGDVRRL